MLKAFVWIGLVAALVTGCAVAPQVEQSPELLRATHGYVHMSQPLDGRSAPVTLRPVKGGQDHEVMRRPGHERSGFGLWIPAGEYQIVDLVQKDGARYPPIPIEPGRITDLGAVIKLALGGDEYATVALSHPEADLERQRATERLRSHLLQTQALQWRTATMPRPTRAGTASTDLGLIAELLMEYHRHVNRPPKREQITAISSAEAAYQLAAQGLRPITDEPGLAADGSLYFGADLGRIRVRRPDAQWTTLDTGTLASITAVEVAGDVIAAGTSSGALRVSRDHGQTWQEAVVLAASEPVIDIDFVGSRWMIVTAALGPVHPFAQLEVTMTGWKVHATQGKDLQGVSLVRASSSFDPVISLWSIAARGHRASDNTYYFNGATELLKFDMATLKAIELRPPQSSITRISASTDGRALAAFLARGAFSKLNLSTDGGSTWRALAAPPYPAYDLYFGSLNDAMASYANTGAFSYTLEWVKYDATADRWVKSHEAPRGCSRLLRDATKKQNFCVTSGGSILHWRGDKWVAEFADE